MQQGMAGMPVEDFPNVIPLERMAPAQHAEVDTADTAPPADPAEQGLQQAPAPAPPPATDAAKPAPAGAPPADPPPPKH
jgi:hypothetical protein